VNAYYNLVSDLIGYYRVMNTSSTTPILSYRNIEKAVTKGADVDVDIRPHGSLTFALGYTYLSATDGNGNALPFHAANTVNLRVRYALTDLGAEGTLRARWRDRLLVIDDQVNTSIYSGSGTPQYSHLPSSLIADVRISKRLFESFEFSGGINNIFGTTQYPFGQVKGREMFVSLTYNMK
jgi:outer membrane receptor for ferrienterochelin and colicin